MAQHKDKSRVTGTKGSGPIPTVPIRREPLCNPRLLRPPTCSGVEPEGRDGDRRQVLRSGGLASATFHAEGPGVKAEEEGMVFDRTAGRARLQSPGSRAPAKGGTCSEMTVWYPRCGEGQDGAAHWVPNKACNAGPRASFGITSSSLAEHLTLESEGAGFKPRLVRRKRKSGPCRVKAAFFPRLRPGGSAKDLARSFSYRRESLVCPVMRA